jgi:hypothetical protein
MQISQYIKCDTFPCADVDHAGYILPGIEINPEDVSVILISESAPADSADYYYAPGNPLFQQTTVQAFQEAGIKVSSIKDILHMGVYLTTAVKCGKTGYGIKAGTIKECSLLLEKEISGFPNVKVFLLMGDVAIKSLNYIAGRAGEPRVIPPGSTYKIRGGEYYYKSARVFPSYLQAGPSYFIEQSKRKMIASDIAAALSLARS